MSNNDLQLNEKRWQRKRLFRKQRRFTLSRSFLLVLLLAAVVVLGWWFGMLPEDWISRGSVA